ncbi:MAG: RidA family protein, partial [Bacteroidota bacterium]
MKRSIVSLIIIAIVFACNSPKAPEKPADNLYSYDVEERIDSLGITLKEPTPPVANYVNSVRSGNLIFMAGKGPT